MVQGVVFYVDSTNFHGWAVALHDDGEMPWGSSYTNVSTLTDYTTAETAEDDLDGYANTQKIRAAGDVTSFPAAWAVDFANGWYLPAEGQLVLLREEETPVNITLSQVGGTSFGGGSYWSSTEYSDYFTWSVIMSSNNPITALYKSGYLLVRAVRAF